jgi:hypothetical protein
MGNPNEVVEPLTDEIAADALEISPTQVRVFVGVGRLKRLADGSLCRESFTQLLRSFARQDARFDAPIQWRRRRRVRARRIEPRHFDFVIC